MKSGLIINTVWIPHFLPWSPQNLKILFNLQMAKSQFL